MLPIFRTNQGLTRISHQDHESKRNIRVHTRRSGAKSVAIATLLLLLGFHSEFFWNKLFRDTL
jgi:hypothetical protein